MLPRCGFSAAAHYSDRSKPTPNALPNKLDERGLLADNLVVSAGGMQGNGTTLWPQPTVAPVAWHAANSA
jgi:hypothetical protein